MIVYTNENNPATLKILIAANFKKQNIDLKTIQLNEKGLEEPNILPYLETESNQILFIPNAAARYLLPCVKNELECEQWMSWESSVLNPLLTQLGRMTKNIILKTHLNSCLKYLNDSIGANISLIGDTIQVCDIVIWSSLYPLYNDHNAALEYLDGFSNIQAWLKLLEDKKEFQDGLKSIKITSNSYTALANGCRFVPSIPSNSLTMNANNATLQAEDEITLDELNSAKEAWLNGASTLPVPKEDAYPVLPQPGQKNILITSALPYVNNVPHLGNIIGCVLSADVFARFCRLCNYNTLFICGTDEYGTATETKALEEGLTPQQICDKYFEVHNAIYRWFNIGFDYFGRTTTPEQTKLVQEMFLDLNNNGFMQVQAVDQLLCENCNRYLADRFVEGICPHPGCKYEDARGDQCDGCGKLVNAVELKNPRCKVCGKAPVIRSSQQYFLDLPKLEPLLLHWMEKSAPGWSHNASTIGKTWMKEGLKPRCITRDLKWGIPVPVDGFKDKVFYVWFDAPIGYMSITQRYTKEWTKWWQPEPNTEVKLYQFMAKDNVPFHSVMFPAILLGANKNYITVSHLMATEYLNYEDGKFSKSRGVGVFGNDAQNTDIPSDVWRFYLLYVRPESQDSSFSWTDLATKCNSELLNNFGNFVNRALVFTEKFFNSTVPVMKLIEEDLIFLAHATREFKGYISSLEKAKLRDGIRYILAITKHGNQYIQSTQPWVLVKGTDEQKERAATIIGVCCNITSLLATLLYPYMPEASRSIKTQLNVSSSTVLVPSNPVIVNLLKTGHKIGKPIPLFTKIEPDYLEQLKMKFAGKRTNNSAKTQELDASLLEKMIKEQGDKVRALKSSGSEKSIWQPEVTILLELKKKLEVAQKLKAHNLNSSSVQQNSISASVEAINKLEQEIQKQGDKVRALKSSGVEKSIWQPEVAILLELKKKLGSAQKLDANNVGTNSDNVKSTPTQVEDLKKLEEEIEKQGLVVRKLKESGVPKSEWQPAVDILLALKGKLAVATGQPPAKPGKGKKGKNK